ncbi:hypothetical protein A9Q99_05160 [Gammaproteobacteria bacterium 45_16_T64]|nr:hypothetical protein A9Q99_05160 [Gammaproteobacteria bacterium 45_16_T64]
MRLKINIPPHAINNAVISIVFLFMMVFFLGSLYQYWYNVLDPRLRLAAETQAEILSQSQAGALLKALEIKDDMQREKAILIAFEEMLLITDPSIDEPFIKGVALEVDYDVVAAVKGSLDLREGTLDCGSCIDTKIAVIDDELNMLAVAHFSMTDAYYRWLGADLKAELVTQAFIIPALFVVVWVIILVLVYRLNKVNKNIEIADRAKTRFMANVSHELRTPLNAILGYTQLFKKDTGIMEAQGRGVDTIHRSAAHLLTLINDILDFSKVDSDGIQLMPSDVPLLDFLNTLVEMTAVRAEMKDIKLIYEFPEDLPAAVFVDDKRLRQVLLNLLNNAVKFTENGEVTFSIVLVNSKKHSDGDSCVLRFTIADTGIGIPQSMLEDIFIPYRQVGNSMTSAEGSGLGLTISKNLIALMGGDLTVKSQLGEGSAFLFDLQLSTVDQKIHSTSTLSTRVVGYEGERRNILIVDDIDFNREVLRQMLQQLGFVVSELDGGSDILKQLESENTDLLFLDIYMPDKDGFSVLNEIRSAGYREVPVIALTAAAREDMREKIHRVDFQDILEKPIEEEVVLSLLGEHLGLTWIHSQPDQSVAIADMPMVLPDSRILLEMKEHAEKHNILAIRQLIKGLGDSPEYGPFLRRIGPLVGSYQFLKVIQFIERVE